MKYVLLISIAQMVFDFQRNITEDILNDKFSKYFNQHFIEVNEDSAYDYGFSYHYNYVYPKESHIPFQFLNQTVKKAAFSVTESDDIEQVILHLDLLDIDSFYKLLTEKFGQPQIVSLSKFYIEQQGLKTPDSIDKSDNHYYDSVPIPTLRDYKNLKNVNWYEVNSASLNVNTEMIVRNLINPEIQHIETYEVAIIFRRSKGSNQD